MTHSNKPLLKVLAGETVSPPPVWLMRQAGRYLAEYREVRARAGDFIKFCFSPDLAAEVTLQPIRRFGFDAAILFADILLIPIALGRKVWFVAGEGPRLEPFDVRQFEDLTTDTVRSVLGPVGETLTRVKPELPDETTLIGFAGAPWTVATYMVEGGGSKDRFSARVAAWQHPEAFDGMLERIADATAEYLVMQAESGAEVLKIFDSWAEGLPEPLFERVVINPTKRIVDRVRAAGVTVPIIGFPRGAGSMYARYARETGVNAVALDTGMDPAYAQSILPDGMPVQGHLDPAALRAGGDALDRETDRILDSWAGRPHIFNLGHGITPDVPVDHVHQLLRRIRERG
ncbi:MAG: uroporphyrinogen decarboxylase [Alphaproteobacteria bacterium]|jgi:uroporphyrinogen decarboxylase|uniref:uroporphyrinogen decarboxylase n=1 Tax=Maricaulis alexandrii TaxID=2570354 RepID=UPI0011081554|nr:uroporphyrinogen decarboxylase [Maricaulis alexandrii]MCR9266043.1 uroporphyrinogen decarboxylase [Alphaproteobacteria bacterium]